MLLEFFPDGYMLSISNISPPIKYTLPFEFSFFFLFTSCLFQSSSWNITSLVLYSTANDPQPQMIPRPQMIPKMDRK